MKYAHIILLFFLLLIPSVAFAEEVNEGLHEPKTKIEQFPAKTGSVIVRGFEEVGRVKGLYNTSITVSSEEFTMASTQQKEYGITIDVIEGPKSFDQKTSYIDYDEIDSLILGIEYISKINSEATQLSSFQADYRTRGSLRISTFNTEKEINAAIESGQYSSKSAYFKILDLAKVKDLILKAKNKIDNIK